MTGRKGTSVVPPDFRGVGLPRQQPLTGSSATPYLPRIQEPARRWFSARRLPRGSQSVAPLLYRPRRERTRPACCVRLGSVYLRLSSGLTTAVPSRCRYTSRGRVTGSGSEPPTIPAEGPRDRGDGECRARREPWQAVGSQSRAPLAGAASRGQSRLVTDVSRHLDGNHLELIFTSSRHRLQHVVLDCLQSSIRISIRRSRGSRRPPMPSRCPDWLCLACRSTCRTGQ